MSVRSALVVSIALVAATLSPVVREPSDDGYPLSTYPMFSWKRPTKLRMTYGLGLTAAGERRYLSPSLAGSIEVLQAKAVFDRAARGGPPALKKLCAEIAARVARHAAFTDVVVIRIVDGTHDAIELLVRDVVGPEIERMRCPVTR